MTSFSGFPRDTIRFLGDLADNNNRNWFAENKTRYESSFLAPALQFINAMEKPIEKAAPLLRASARKSGGSLMRIYRDTRFSKDKAPYKCNMGIQFRHELGKDVHAPGVYLHIEPGQCFVGAGMWRPDSTSLKKIRTFIAENPTAWKRMRRSKSQANLELYDDRLKSAPRGIDKDHPLIDDLRLKSFLLSQKLSRKQIESDTITEVTSKFIKDCRPLMRTLCEALEQPY